MDYNNHDQDFQYNVGDLLVRVKPDDNSSGISTIENFNNIASTENCSTNVDTNSSQYIEDGNQFVILDNSYADDESNVYNLLKHWSLEAIYPILIRDEVDITSLKYMRNDDVKRLISSSTLGIQIKFRQFLMEFQKLQGTYIEVNSADQNTTSTETTIADSLSLPSSSNQKSSASKNVILEEILNLSIEGKGLIKLSKHREILSDERRSILINLIVNFYIQQNLLMGVKECESMSRQIKVLFPTESEGVYFQRRYKHKPKGQLYDRYNNYTAKLRQHEILPKAKRFKAAPLCIVSEDTPEENAEDVCQYLKYNRDDNNENLIMQKWEETVIYRKNFIRENRAKTISNILEKWPAYTQVYGPKLIQIDFAYLHPEATNMFTHIDRCVHQIIGIMKDKLSDPPCKKMFKEFQQQRNITIDTKNFMTFHLLHGLLRPTTKKCRIINNKKIWNKYTILDSQNAFMIFAKTAQECEKIIENKKSTASIDQNTVQPFVFVVGENEFGPSFFYVYMDGIKYKLPNIVAAIDCAFKIFQVFNIKYPEECVAVWLFIQKFFYTIKTVYDPVYPSVDLFISRLKKE